MAFVYSSKCKTFHKVLVKKYNLFNICIIYFTTLTEKKYEVVGIL